MLAEEPDRLVREVYRVLGLEWGSVMIGHQAARVKNRVVGGGRVEVVEGAEEPCAGIVAEATSASSR